jgi:hypothetical protein
VICDANIGALLLLLVYYSLFHSLIAARSPVYITSGITSLHITSHDPNTAPLIKTFRPFLHFTLLTRTTTQWGVRHSATVLHLDECEVLKQSTMETDGYISLKVGVGEAKDSRVKITDRY